MKTQPAWRGLAIALFFAGAAWCGRAASFSAEFVDTNGGRTRTGLFNIQDKSYRFETADGGQKLVIAFDGRSGVTRVINPTEKAYYEADSGKGMDRLINPFVCYAYFARTAEVRVEGTGKIDGRTCTKQIVSSGEQVFVVAWWSEELGLPLKVEVPILARTVELRNIKPGPQDAALFAVPTGYKLVTIDTEPPPPEWAGQVAKAPVVNPPFERSLKEGEIIRLRPQAGKQIRLKGTNAHAETCAFTAVAFKNGRPLGDVSGNTVNLDAEQEVGMTFTDSPAKADDIVVRVRAGTVKIKAEFSAALGAAKADRTAAAANPASEQQMPTPLPDAEVQAPASADMGSRFEVTWSGPAADGDYVTVARPKQAPGAYLSMTRVREGNPVKIWAPGEAGEFEVRYVLARGTKLLAKAPITINAVTASVEATDPVKVNGWIEVKWAGPGNEGDFVSIARADQAPGASLGRTRLKQGELARVRAPNTPGEYEVRYILGRGNKLLAKSSITIQP
jgi:hypothetical protein